MAHIAPHGDGWRAQVAKAEVRRSKVFKTKAEARLWAARLELEIDSGQAESGHTFEQAIKRYMREVTPRKEGQRWEMLRLQGLLQCPELNMRLHKLDQQHIAAWRDRRLGEVKASTLLREFNLLRHVLRVARDEWRWITHEPVRGVRMPADEPPRTAAWGWRQIRLVLRARAYVGPKTAEVIDAFHISLRTGMRLAEILRAPQGLDAQRQVVILLKSKTTREGKPVVVPVGRRATKLLQRPPFTVGANEASTLFRRLTKSLGINGLTFHDARASAITLLSRKLDVMDLARVSRHKDLSLLLNTYYRPRIEDIAAKM
jgi:hypothetical protein